MKDIQVFSNPKFGDLRTTKINGDIWFVGKDVATALGFTNSRDAIKTHVFQDDKGVDLIDTPGGKQKLTVINESGLYALVFGSRLDTAKEFKHWVTSEVLPTIRKHGAYMTPDMLEQVLLNPDTVIRLATNLKEEQLKNKALKSENEKLKPKAFFADAVSTSKTSILIGELAKILAQNGYKTGQNRLFKQLREEGYLIKRKGSDYNMPTQKSMEMELFEIKESSHTNSDGVTVITKTPKVTGKGQIYFTNRYCRHVIAN